MSLRADLGIGLGIVAGLAVLGVIWWRQGGQKLITQTLNPASPDNVVYQTVSAPFDGSLGARLWEWFNPGAVAAEQQAINPRPTSGITLTGAPPNTDTIEY